MCKHLNWIEKYYRDTVWYWYKEQREDWIFWLRIKDIYELYFQAIQKHFALHYEMISCFDVQAQVPNCALFKPPHPTGGARGTTQRLPRCNENPDQTYDVGFPRISWDSLSMNGPPQSPHFSKMWRGGAAMPFLGSQVHRTWKVPIYPK